MSDEFPEGWTRVKLDVLNDPGAPICYGVLKPGDAPAKGILMLRVKDVRDGWIDTSDILHISSSLDAEFRRSRIQPGDVLISVQGSVGRVAIVPPELVGANISRTIARIRPLMAALGPWLGIALRSHQVQVAMGAVVGGTTRDSLNIRDLREVDIALPPLAEQHRVVAKAEELLAGVNRAKSRLAKTQMILKRFRQSVLVAACSGELTREWRTSTSSPRQTGAELLAKIRTRRLELGLPSARREIDDEDIELPDTALPDDWTWCRVGEIADVRLGGTPSRKEPIYWGGSVPWVSSGEVANCRITNTTERITKKGLENSNAKLYPPGTVLIAMIGEGKTRGQSAILDIEACTNQNAAGLVFDAGFVDAEYVWLWALSEYEKNRDVGRGGNQPALNGAKVRALPLPLPPLEEQRAIAAAANKALSLITMAEARVASALSRAEKLPQAILSKAFSGELVPTEAELARVEGRSYETASMLLERITSSKAPETTKGVKRVKQRQQRLPA